MNDPSIFRSILEHAVEGILITGPDRRIAWVNPSFVRITGYEAKDAVGRNPSFMQSGLHEARFYAELWDALRRQDWWQGEIWNRRKSGDLFVESATIRAIRGAGGEVAHYVSIFTDITERKVAERQLQKDLQLAKQIQQRVVSPPLCDDHIRIEAHYASSEALGGDMYAWQRIGPGRYGIFLMDVMGHGVAASLIGMSVRSLLHGSMLQLDAPAEVMSALNRHMRGLYFREYDRDVPLYFFTAIYLVVDTNRRLIHYVNAGHPPAILADADGHARKLGDGGVPIGVLAQPDISACTLSFEPGSRLLLYTDGLIEAAGASLYEGIERLSRLAADRRAEANGAFIDRVAREFIGQRPHGDDVCIISASLR